MLHAKDISWFYDVTWYILFSILSWPMISTQYLCLYWPLLVFVFFVNCGVQQTYRRLQLNRNSSQSSSHQISGWANASSLDWIFFFMSWCLEVPAWTSFLFCSIFLDTLSFSNLRIDVLVMMTSRFWEIIVIELVFINEFKSSALLYVDSTLKC